MLIRLINTLLPKSLSRIAEQVEKEAYRVAIRMRLNPLYYFICRGITQGKDKWALVFQVYRKGVGQPITVVPLIGNAVKEFHPDELALILVSKALTMMEWAREQTDEKESES